MSETSVTKNISSLRANRQYLLLWSGQSLSLLGDWFFSATITLWILEHLAFAPNWRPLAMGAVPLLAVLPSLLLSPIAGVFVDRWNTRLTMLSTDLLRLCVVTLLLLVTLFVTSPVWLLLSCYLALLLCASGTQFFMPARIAMVNDIVPAEQHPQAYGSLQQVNYLAQVFGPALAAPLYLAFGPMWAIGFNAASYLVSYLLLLSLQSPTPTTMKEQQADFWSEFRTGMRFFVGNRILVTLLLSGAIFMFGGMAYNTFEYLYGVENLHIPTNLLGLYVACYGFGVIIGLPVVGALVTRIGAVNVLWMGLLLNGVFTLVLAFLTSMLPGMLCGVLLGLSSSSIFVTVRPLTVRVTPRELIGRVMAFETPIITISSLLGGLLATVLASTVLVNVRVHIGGFTLSRLNIIFLGASLLILAASVFVRFTTYRAVKQLEPTHT